MKSSTTIAEKLGHLTYFDFLREYYNCFTKAIIACEGEIYQYVGDEIILSWKVKGNEKDNRCIDCFFAMKESLNRQKEWFMKKFGFAPEFKAGIHFGKVTTGEVGVIKKEILFSGDVLNATARMQGLCNSFGVDLILSDDMTKQLKLSGKLEPVFLGEVELRGKEEKKKLYTVNRAK
jgi:adenylate cyclase